MCPAISFMALHGTQVDPEPHGAVSLALRFPTKNLKPTGGKAARFTAQMAATHTTGICQISL